MIRKEERTAYLVLLPVVLFIAVFTIYPLFMAVFHSFTSWDGINPGKWTGLKNYWEILSDSLFYRLVLNNVVIVLSIPVQIFISLVLTLLLYERTAGWKFFRSVFFLPYVLSAVVIGYLFAIFFSYEGPLNTLLRSLGLEILALDWLASGTTGMTVIVLCIIWASFGQGTLIFLSGMSMIPPSVFESSKIDGAGWWHRLFHIVLPLLVRSIEFFAVISIIWSFTGTFSFIYSITAGGPGYETTPVDYMIYLKAFKDMGSNSMGYACALAMILFGMIILLSRLQMKVVDILDDWGE